VFLFNKLAGFNVCPRVNWTVVIKPEAEEFPLEYDFLNKFVN
jgi:hypothetical protein